MTLAAGERLGSYEVLGPIGAGGMGQVYRARDARLDREVALKVLPPHLAGHPEALARFEREAKAVAALSHPNILAIYDVGEAGGRAFAVMELLEGETLRERLRPGALPQRKAVEIAAQIANGLAAAHERGIVHRDLKPENVFVLGDGRVKILDFGLAKQGDAPGSQSQLMAAATMAHDAPGTEPGAVLGTVGYMSPEQVKGQPADARSDLFSLGVILYEMLTGRRAFARDSSVETMSAILKEEPPELELLAAKIPPALDHVLRRCLEKVPGERFQSARDLAFALRDSTGGSSSTAAARALHGAPASRRARMLGAVAVAALAGIAIGYLLGRRGAPTDPASKALRPSFRQLTKVPGGEWAPALSPDGTSFVFERDTGGQLDLYLQRVDGQTAIPLTADCREDDRDAAFSPDGTRIAYHSDCGGGGLFVMGATGENARRVADFGFNPSWSPDGREIAVTTERAMMPWNRPTRSELWAIEIDSGAKRLVTRVDAMHPAWSPSGKRIAFWGLPENSFSRDLWTVAADGSETTYEQASRLTDDAHLDWNPVWSTDGRFVLFASSRGGTFNIWRLPVDEATGERRGDPEPVTAPTSWAGWLSPSRDGRRIAFVDRNARTTVLRAGLDPARGVLTSEPQPVLAGSIEVYDVGLSPRGDSLVVSSTDPPQQLFVMGLDGGGFRQVTDGPHRSRQAVWSPDGRDLVFQSSRFSGGLAAIRPDGGGLRDLLPGRSESAADPEFSTDGRRVAFGGWNSSWLLQLSPSLEPGELREIPSPLEGALFAPSSFSPDDRWLAGSLQKTGPADGIAIVSLLDGKATRIDLQGMMQPKLLGNGERLVAISGQALVAIDGPHSAPRVLVAAPPGHAFRNLSMSHDRQSIAWVDEVDESDIWLMTLEEPAR